MKTRYELHKMGIQYYPNATPHSQLHPSNEDYNQNTHFIVSILFVCDYMHILSSAMLCLYYNASITQHSSCE